MNVLSGKTALVTSAPRVTGRTLRALAKFPGLLGYPQSTSGASFRGFEGHPHGSDRRTHAGCSGSLKPR